MKSFHIGISKIEVEKKTLEEFFGENDLNKLDKIMKELDSSKNKMIGLQINGSQEIIITKEDNDNIYVKKLRVSHKGKSNIEVMFDLDEESDGTIRLLDFAPAFQDVAINKKVYVIDEIERSIHPLLIKELVRKFSKDDQSKGQLIFTTHESNLLDQSIFRQDEIWFTEKDKNGSTDLYSLSDFKEHNTIDIRKGYLMGRYGSVPFLGNLKDLNWHDYDTKN
jgi:AAA15 family ATPase/GTPase